MKPTQVYFEGTRWPNAELATAQHPEDERLFPRIGINTSGVSRNWSTTTTLGFWRSFPEIATAEDAIDWVRRYGDPAEQSDAHSRIISSEGWKDLAEELSEFDRLWAAPGEDGVSHFSKPRGRPIDVDLPGVTVNISSQTGIRMVVRNLNYLMRFSAADALLRQVPMRRCEVCSHWFELRRSTGRVCSNRCQQIKSSKRKGSYDGLGS